MICKLIQAPLHSQLGLVYELPVLPHPMRDVVVTVARAQLRDLAIDGLLVLLGSAQEGSDAESGKRDKCGTVQVQKHWSLRLVGFARHCGGGDSGEDSGGVISSRTVKELEGSDLQVLVLEQKRHTTE